MAFRTTYIIDVKLKIIKIRTGCQYVDYVYYSGTQTQPHKAFDWAAQAFSCARGLQVGHSCFRAFN